ncbi:peptidylprolyl isomerase [Marinicella meishanensis]|uniref:peptidylprolyl isomerase n=1 Tax=Marinicella meishanensis TaxID=2873263 RepID=UPI001CBD3511|nr:peptidyl-prolyl cis-trans isomerase [Marinicella sp. NBU2979]
MKYLMLLLFVPLLACQQEATQSIADHSPVLAQVGDWGLTEQYLQTYLQSQGVTEPNAQQRQRALDELIQQMALAHQAKVNDIQPALTESLRMEMARHQVMAQAAIEQYLADRPITEEAIKEEYQRVTAELKGVEYHVRHLLYQDEVAALTALDQLAAGASYVDLEASYLAALPQAKNVGDIGWVNIMQVPEAFRAPLETLQPGQHYGQVINSQFGVHVLFLQDKRALAAPDYEQVKAGIQASLERQLIERYRQLAVIKAKVQVQD